MGTTRDLEALRSPAFAVESIRAEQGTCQEAAEQAAAEIDALTWNVGKCPAGQRHGPGPRSDGPACGRTPARESRGDPPRARISDTTHKIAGECSPRCRPRPKIGRNRARATAHPSSQVRRLRRPHSRRSASGRARDGQWRASGVGRLGAGRPGLRRPTSAGARPVPPSIRSASAAIGDHPVEHRPDHRPPAVRVVTDTRAIYVRSGSRCAVAHVATAAPGTATGEELRARSSALQPIAGEVLP